MGWTPVYRRVYEAKLKSKLSWNEIAKKAKIPLHSWMTGVPYCNPSDDDLRKIAPVLNTTYEWLKYGKQPEADDTSGND